MYTTLLYSESPIIGSILTIIPIITLYYGYISVSIVLFIILFIFMHFYRYKPTHLNIANDYLVSPAEGVISNIMIDKGYCYISIFLSPFNRHTQIYPCNGLLLRSIYDNNGRFNLATNIDKCRNNEKAIHYILMNNYSLIQVTQIAGFLPRCISYDNTTLPKDVSAGGYLGMIKFGSRVDLLFPLRSADGNSFFQLGANIRQNNCINIGDNIGQYIYQAGH